MEPEFLDFIESDQTILEKQPLERVASIGQLNAFKHGDSGMYGLS